MSQHWWQSPSRFYRIWQGIDFWTAVGDSVAGVLKEVSVLATWRTQNEVKSMKSALNAYYAEYSPQENEASHTFIVDLTPFSGELTLYQTPGQPTAEELKQRLKEHGQRVIQAIQSESSISFLSSPYRDFYMSLMEQENIYHLNFKAITLSPETRKNFYAFLKVLLSTNPRITEVSLNPEEQALLEHDSPDVIEQLAFHQRRKAIHMLSEQSRASFPFSDIALKTWKSEELEPFMAISEAIFTELEQMIGKSLDEKIVIPLLNGKIKQATTPTEKDQANETLSFYHAIRFMRFQLTEALQQVTGWISLPFQEKASSGNNTRDSRDHSSLVISPKKKNTGWSISNLWRQCFSSSRNRSSSDEQHSSSHSQQALMGKPKSPETTEEIEAYLKVLPVQLLIPRREDKNANLAQCQAEVSRILAIDNEYKQGKIDIEERNERILYEGLIKHGFNYDYSFAFEGLDFDEMMQLKSYLEHQRLFPEITCRISPLNQPESYAFRELGRDEIQTIISLLDRHKEEALRQKIQNAGRNYPMLLLLSEEIHRIQKILLTAPESIIPEEKALLLRKKFLEYYKKLELDRNQIDDLKAILVSSHDTSIRSISEKILFNVHKKLLVTKQSFCHPDTVRKHLDLQPDFQKASAILSSMDEWAEIETDSKRTALHDLSNSATEAEVYQGRLDAEAKSKRIKEDLNICKQDHARLVKMRKALNRHVQKKSREKERVSTNLTPNITHDGSSSDGLSSNRSSQNSLCSSGSSERLSEQHRLRTSITTLSRNPSLLAICSEQKGTLQTTPQDHPIEGKSFAV